MSEYMAALEACPLIGMKTGTERRTLRQKVRANAGIYVLYDDNVPVYVGRSDRLADRLLEHSRPSSGSESASFAFNLAKREFRENNMGGKLEIDAMSRKDMAKVPNFNALFAAAKKRVGEMQVRVAEVADPIEQSLLEVYAHLELGTDPELNSFENH